MKIKFRKLSFVDRFLFTAHACQATLFLLPSTVPAALSHHGRRPYTWSIIGVAGEWHGFQYPVCKPGKVLSTAANKANVNAPPNKIPRLANATSVCIPQKVPNFPATAPAPHRTARPASPSPSRLPTLVPKRPRHGHHPSVSNIGDVALKVPAHRANATEWMKNAVNAVVKPGNSKGERPGLRKVRRRRSSANFCSKAAAFNILKSAHRYGKDNVFESSISLQMYF